MRLFVAVTPSPEALADLDVLTGDLRQRDGVDDRYRWTARDQWHITLAFLGNVEEETLPELTRRLARAATRHRQMRLAVERGGGFGSARRARVLWAGVAGDVDALRKLAGSVAAAARRSGIEVEDKRFRPHVTLARLREQTDVRPVVSVLSGYAGPDWLAGELELVRSDLGQGAGQRALHETIASWPLQPDAAIDGSEG